MTVVRPGVHTSLQDLGRFGCTRYGMSQGGAVDLHAHAWANKLLENPAHCATLEITIGMARFLAEADLQLAITGADMQARVNDSPVGNWCSFSIKRGQSLTLKAASRGMRAYLAVQGGVHAVPVLGSVSTVVRNQLGSLLAEGDFLSADVCKPGSARHVPARYIPQYSDEIELRVIESGQVADFSPEALRQFYGSVYTVTQDCDRMGVRLEGNPIPSTTGGVISEGIALGAVQIPADGQPIILLNDRQTLGGYPKPGCIARIDLPRLAQARPGTRIRFSSISLAEARRQWQAFRRFMLD
ncbi:MAG: biotin-dependent carboxyltransferase [Akkermansiaceae bacterium]|nr:biotin-dependent carboxyltransferase [Akkermansiaceae bacterium]